MTPATTTPSAPQASTTTEASATTAAPTATTTAAPTAPPTTAPAGPVEAVVDSGATPAGPWRLVAQPGDRPGVCAELQGPFQFGGRVCNQASEQDYNGHDTLRYSGAGDGSFVIGVSSPNVARVRMELVGGATVERATVAAPFTAAARFVALPRRATPLSER